MERYEGGSAFKSLSVKRLTSFLSLANNEQDEPERACARKGGIMFTPVRLRTQFGRALSGLFCLGILVCVTLPLSCGPSTEARLQVVYSKHKEAIAKCDKLAAEMSGGFMGTMKALEAGNVSGSMGPFAGAQGAYQQAMECRSKLNAAIKADLNNAGLEEKDWVEYLERRKKDAVASQNPTN